MFDDLIASGNSDGHCPGCGYRNFIYTESNGYFINRNAYKQEVECNICGKKYWVTIDSNLKIIKE